MNEDRITIAVEETEKHFHNSEVWFGDAASPEAGVHEADKESLTPFQVDSGNNDWGTAICVLGTSDTPSATGMTKFDLHKILIVSAERAGAVSYLRITSGATEAAGITAGTSTVVAFFVGTPLRMSAIEFLMRRATAGTKVWVNAKVAADTGTVDFLFGLHEYKVYL